MEVTFADITQTNVLCNSEMPGRRCRCGVAVVRGRVYGVGGFNGSLRVRREKLLLEKSTNFTKIPILPVSVNPLGPQTGFVWASLLIFIF